MSFSYWSFSQWKLIPPQPFPLHTPSTYTIYMKVGGRIQMGEGTVHARLGQRSIVCRVTWARTMHRHFRGLRIPGSGSSAAPLRGVRRFWGQGRVGWTNRSTRHCAALGEGTSHQFPVGGERKNYWSSKIVWKSLYFKRQDRQFSFLASFTMQVYAHK